MKTPLNFSGFDMITQIFKEAAMPQIVIRGNKTKAKGSIPASGVKAKSFTLTRTDLSDIRFEDFTGKNIILNIFPSIDTPVCSASVRRFNVEAAKIPDTAVLCVSMDLPFAHGRFCAAEGIDHVVSLSAFRSPDFIDHYGLVVDEGPLKGLLARYVVVIDKTGRVVFGETIADLAEEPDYEKILACLSPEKKGAEPTLPKDQLPLERCVYPATAEDSRLFHDDGPCDDGRAG